MRISDWSSDVCSSDLLPQLAGRRVTLGVRPEHLHPSEEATASFQAQVQLVETLGADTLAHGTLAGNGEALTVRLPGSARPQDGQTLPLAADPGELHFFDPEAGRRQIGNAPCKERGW